MTRIKVVPNVTPNADGEWLEVPVDLPSRMKWKIMETLIAPFVPDGHHIVSVERGTQERSSSNYEGRILKNQ